MWWWSLVMFHYGLCHMNIQEVPRVLPNSLKGQGVYYHVYVICAHKRTHVDCWNMPNHCTSIYHEWMCVCVAALKAIVTRYTAQSVMRTCMLPRELIWERVAPSHTGVTQNSGWPLLQLLWSAPEKAQSLMWCAISNVVSLSLSLMFSVFWYLCMVYKYSLICSECDCKSNCDVTIAIAKVGIKAILVIAILTSQCD